MFFGIKNGYLKSYMEWSYPSSEGTPAYHMVAGLATLSSIVNRKYFIKLGRDKLFTNLWICLVGRSRIARKTTTMRGGEELLRMVYGANENIPVYPNKYTLASITKAIGENNTDSGGVMFWSELKSALKNMELSHNAGLMELFTELYDVPPQWSYKRATQDDDGSKVVKLIYPCWSIISATVPGWMYDWVADERKLSGGFMQRNHFVLEDENSPRVYGHVKVDEELERSLVVNLDTIRKKTICDAREYDFCMQRLTLPKDVEGLYNDWIPDFRTKESDPNYFKGRDSFEEALIVTALKVAMLMCIGEGRHKISKQDMLDATIVVSKFKDSLKDVFDIGRGKWDTIIKSIKKFVDGFPADSIPASEIHKHFDGSRYSGWDVSQALDTMVKREQLIFNGEEYKEV